MRVSHPAPQSHPCLRRGMGHLWRNITRGSIALISPNRGALMLWGSREPAGASTTSSAWSGRWGGKRWEQFCYVIAAAILAIYYRIVRGWPQLFEDFTATFTFVFKDRHYLLLLYSHHQANESHIRHGDNRATHDRTLGAEGLRYMTQNQPNNCPNGDSD
jgi:hypothetical protein